MMKKSDPDYNCPRIEYSEAHIAEEKEWQQAHKSVLTPVQEAWCLANPQYCTPGQLEDIEPAAPITAKIREYSSNGAEPGNPKLFAIFMAMLTLLQQKELEPVFVRRIIEDIESEHAQFNSTLPAPKGSENWKNQKSVQLLWAPTVAVNAVYRKRAERHVRACNTWHNNLEQYKAYLQRKSVKKERTG